MRERLAIYVYNIYLLCTRVRSTVLWSVNVIYYVVLWGISATYL